MLGFYESFDKQKEMLRTQQNWKNVFMRWKTQGPFGKKTKNTQNSKGSAFTKNQKSSTQKMNSKKKTPPVKKGKSLITPAKKKELTKVLVEILGSIF